MYTTVKRILHNVVINVERIQQYVAFQPMTGTKPKRIEEQY